MSYDKDKVLAAFTVISDASDYHSTLSNAVMLLAIVVDTAERIAPEKKRRVEVKVASNSLKAPYNVIIEELERD